MSENFPEHLIPLYSYAINLLSAREYSENMLREKIEKKFPKSDEYEHGEVLRILTQKNYLNERRTIENFLRYRREYSPRGKRLIAQDMFRKKMDTSLSAEVLEENFPEEEQQKDCTIVAEKKWDQIQKISYKQEAQAPEKTGQEDIYAEELREKKQEEEKLFRFLAGKGFPYSMIQQSWENMLNRSDQ